MKRSALILSAVVFPFLFEGFTAPSCTSEEAQVAASLAATIGNSACQKNYGTAAKTPDPNKLAVCVAAVNAGATSAAAVAQAALPSDVAAAAAAAPAAQ